MVVPDNTTYYCETAATYGGTVLPLSLYREMLSHSVEYVLLLNYRHRCLQR